MFDYARASHMYDIAFIESLKDTLRSKTYAKISRQLNVPIEKLSYEVIKNIIHVKGENITRTYPVTTPPTRVYSFVYPLITTKWDQGSPYNCKHPEIVINKNTGVLGMPVAGCVPVAIAQIFAYCEVPAFKAQGQLVNWTTLKATQRISPSDPLTTRAMVGNLLLEIFQQVKAYYKYTNGIYDGTWAYYAYSVPYIRKIISTGVEQSYNWTVVQNSLTSLQPVIVQGQGHSWILDGYAICKKSGSTGTSQYDTYVTTNFGWNGSWDGYYKLSDDFSADFFERYQTAQLSIIPYCKRQ